MRYIIVGGERVKNAQTGERAVRWTMRLTDGPEQLMGKSIALGWSEGRTEADRAVAEQAAKETLRELCRKHNLPLPLNFPSGGDMTLADLAPLYLGACATRGSDRNGRNAGAIKKWIIPFFGDRPLQSLRPQDGDAWVKWYREQLIRKGKHGEPGRPMAIGTLDRDRRVLRALMNYAVDSEYLTKNPFRKLRTPKGLERKRPIMLEELIALGPHMTRQLKAATLAGLMIVQRQEIIYDIHREHIVKYPSGYVVNLRSARSWTKLNVETMPLNRIAMAALAWENPTPISGRIFHTWGSANSLSKEFTKAVKRCRIKHAVYHDLRHTAATALQNARFNPMAIEKLLGHSLGGVIGRYQHGWDELYREAADILEQTYLPLAQAWGFGVAGVAKVSEVSSQ